MTETAHVNPSQLDTEIPSSEILHNSWEKFLAKIGIPPSLFWGFVGLLIFMSGDGAESGYLASYLVNHGQVEHNVALLFTIYGISAAISSWLSGALSDIWGPRRVMAVGLIIWVCLQIGFLGMAIPANSFILMTIFYGIRGFGYPLFAFGFLVWVVTTVNPTKLGSAVGWFWFCFATGLPTLGAVFARYMIPWIGSVYTLWAALCLVIAGGVLALYGIKNKQVSRNNSEREKDIFGTLFSSLSIAWKRPKVGIGSIVRAIDTSAEFGFLVCLPIYFTRDLHFTLNQWLLVLQALALSNVIWNLLFGILSDKLSWRGTVMVCGGFGSTITTLLLYWTPTYFGPDHIIPTLIVGALYGMTLAAYAPLSALMPYLAPEDKPAAMSLLNLGAGASVWVGPAIVYLVQPFFGVLGVMITFAIIYFISGILTYFLTLDPDVQAEIDLLKKNKKTTLPARENFDKEPSF